MSILIVGSEGNMGRRYKAILRYLGKEFICADMAEKNQIKELASRSEGVIIATPTHTHVEMLDECLELDKPILCEKPFTKNIFELRRVISKARESKAKLNMVMQYKELVNPLSVGPSSYDYFRHGSDGLVWDCIQIIALAKNEVTLTEESPVWKCRINGTKLDLGHMDSAYVLHVDNWLKKPGQSLAEIEDAHEKTAMFKEKHFNG